MLGSFASLDPKLVGAFVMPIIMFHECKLVGAGTNDNFSKQRTQPMHYGLSNGNREIQSK